MIDLRLEAVSDTAKLPTYGSDQAACFDLRGDLLDRWCKGSGGSLGVNCVDGEMVLNPGKRYLIPTGFIFHIPDGYQMKINPRSGLAWKNGITILNAPATIDSDYKDETFVVLYNTSSEPFIVNHGDRIAQAEIVSANRVDLESLGERGGGFGSSGVK